MWFKKKSVLQADGHYNSNTAVDGTDWRTNPNSNSWSASETLPSAADAGNYFYLPALGTYFSSQLSLIGNGGYYWSSSARPYYYNYAYCLRFFRGNVIVADYDRGNGYRGDWPD